jgi:hypothetical protein
MTPTGQGYLDRIRNAVKSGMVTVGYSGEHEPTHRNRPKATLQDGMSPEQRWIEQNTVAERFLNEYKDHLTGEPDRTRQGGLSAVHAAFGRMDSAFGFAAKLGSEAPYFHQFRRMQIQPLSPGFPDPYFTMNIHGYRTAITELANGMSHGTDASPEVFWDTNLLRAAFTTSDDIRRVLGEEGPAALKSVLDKLNRSKIRLLQMEVLTYARYLAQWPDGTPRLFPLTWAYDHPEAPEVPAGIRVFQRTVDSDKASDDEGAALNWLFNDFLPANPGSRFVSPQDLLKMARTPLGCDITADQLAAAVKDWNGRAATEVNMSPTYVAAGPHYLSAADLFLLLANSLGKMTGGWKRPDRVRLTHIYGPPLLEDAEQTFPNVTMTAGDVARVAARLAPRLNDQTWQPAPANAIPARVEIAGKSVIPAQFLALMAEAYVAPSPDTPIKLRYFQPFTAPGYFFPRQNSGRDAGHIWTLRPAPLDLR